MDGEHFTMHTANKLTVLLIFVSNMAICDSGHSAIFRVQLHAEVPFQDIASDLIQCALHLLNVGESFGRMTLNPRTCNAWDGTFMAYYNGTIGSGDGVDADAIYLTHQFHDVEFVVYHPPVKHGLIEKCRFHIL